MPVKAKRSKGFQITIYEIFEIGARYGGLLNRHLWGDVGFGSDGIYDFIFHSIHCFVDHIQHNLNNGRNFDERYIEHSRDRLDVNG